MCSVRPHVTVVIYHSNETPKLFQIGGSFHIEDSLDFLLPRFEAGWRQLTEPICLLDRPVTLERVDSETIILQLCKNGVE